MKKTILIAIALTLAACQPAETGQEGTREIEQSTSTSVRRWVDPQTGCEYLLYTASERGGLSPRLGRDGRPICPEQAPGGPAPVLDPYATGVQ